MRFLIWANRIHLLPSPQNARCYFQLSICSWGQSALIHNSAQLSVNFGPSPTPKNKNSSLIPVPLCCEASFFNESLRRWSPTRPIKAHLKRNAFVGCTRFNQIWYTIDMLLNYLVIGWRDLFGIYAMPFGINRFIYLNNRVPET
ncbi:hypothetical protein CEXT_522321 [Caerostris extrusa]|uniref:Uncharacterized protein n=1 Tax=Caerostris extrusa TaxID=172846 RepID=A0AAV4M5C5_CAEEX|nr:hypothetical protein CEXT_522321 [Caerostris extrusa]